MGVTPVNSDPDCYIGETLLSEAIIFVQDVTGIKLLKAEFQKSLISTVC